MRLFSIDSHTSRSCAHRRTAWRLPRASTIDSAVPQAPAPTTAMRLTIYSFLGGRAIAALALVELQAMLGSIK